MSQIVCRALYEKVEHTRCEEYIADEDAYGAKTVHDLKLSEFIIRGRGVPSFRRINVSSLSPAASAAP